VHADNCANNLFYTERDFFFLLQRSPAFATTSSNDFRDDP